MTTIQKAELLKDMYLAILEVECKAKKSWLEYLRTSNGQYHKDFISQQNQVNGMNAMYYLVNNAIMESGK